MKRTLLLSMICISLSACTDNTNEALVECGSGDILTFKGQQYCVYEQSIIETGFECPQQSPHRFDIEGGAVCAQTPMVPDLEQIEERVRTGWTIDEPADPTRCDDDSKVTCDQTRAQTPCPDGQLSALLNGCYQCVPSDTCAPPADPTRCDDASMLTCDEAREDTTCPQGQVNALAQGCYQCVSPNTCMPVAPVQTNGAQLQLLHHMPGATTATVDVYINGNLTYDDLNYREGSAFVDVPDGQLSLEIRDATGTQTLGTGTMTDIGDVEDGRYIALLAGTSDPVAVTGQMARPLQVVEIGRLDPLPPSTDYFATILASASLLTAAFDVRSDNDAWTLLLDDATLGSYSELHVLDALTDDLGDANTITKAFALTNDMSASAAQNPDQPRYFSGFLDVTDRGGQFGVIILSPTQDTDALVPTPEFILHTRAGGPGEAILEGL